jgi:hypothetical protein
MLAARLPLRCMAHPDHVAEVTHAERNRRRSGRATAAYCGYRPTQLMNAASGGWFMDNNQ